MNPATIQILGILGIITSIVGLFFLAYMQGKKIAKAEEEKADARRLAEKARETMDFAEKILHIDQGVADEMAKVSQGIPDDELADRVRRLLSDGIPQDPEAK